MKKVLEINVDDEGNNGVYSLIRSVILNKPADLQIDIAAIEPFDHQENIDELAKYGTKVYYVGYKGNKFKKQKVISANLQKIIKENHYDCVHIHCDVAYKVYVYAKAAKLAGVRRIILHSHASDAENPHRSFKRFMHFTMRGKLKNYGTVFAGCSRLATDWMYPNVPKNEIVMIYNGVDLNRFAFNEESRIKIRDQYHISDDTFLIGHIGRFSYQKNHEFLIEAFRQLHALNPKSKLMLVGDGKDRAHIETLVREDGLQDSVIFTGIQKNSFEYYQAFDLFVLPSHFEGYPIVGIEAQASGLPVIFSDQITTEAKILRDVWYLPIQNSDTVLWADKINEVSRTQVSLKTRNAAAEILKKAKLDIQDTIAAFLYLYR